MVSWLNRLRLMDGVYVPLRVPVYVVGGGVVATEHPLASLAAVEVLRGGGNAVDAAVTASFVLAVTLPHLGGVGGDFFALVRTADGRVGFVNGSCGAPRRLTLELVRGLGYSSMPERGPLTVNPPGMVAGLYEMWRRWGSVEWARLLEPAQRLAGKGHPVSPGFAVALQRHRELLASDPGSRTTYLAVEARPGAVIRYEGLARLLGIIADDPEGFYRGEVAEAIASYVVGRGGVLEAGDLAACRAEVGEPLMVAWRGYRVYEMPPNTQGLTTLHALLLAGELGLDTVEPGGRVWVEGLLRVFHAAYWARDTFLGDPRYMRVSVGELLSPRFLEELKARAVLPSCGEGEGEGGGDTTFYAIADAEGNIVAGIQSLFHPFGSGLTEPKFQVTLNSRASSFTLREGHVNCLAPGKKPLHTLSAVLVEAEGWTIALGLSGGHYRPQLHLQLLLRILGRGEEPSQAIEAPRLLWHPNTCRLTVEEGIDASIPGFEVEVKPYPSRLGVAAAVVAEDSGVRRAYADVRGDGLPAATPP